MSTMAVEIIGMIGTQDVSESRGHPSGPAVNVDYLTRFARAHEAAGLDRVLVTYHAAGPESFAVAHHVLSGLVNSMAGPKPVLSEGGGPGEAGTASLTSGNESSERLHP